MRASTEMGNIVKSNGLLYAGTIGYGQTNEIAIRHKMRVQYANVTSRTIRIGSDLERRMMEEHIIRDMHKQLLSAINSYLVDSGV